MLYGGDNRAKIYSAGDNCRRAFHCLMGAMLFVGATYLSISSPAFAQQSDVQALSNRVARLQREIQDLQRAFYKGEDIPAPSSLSSGGGVAEGQAARINERLSQFENALRSLTGQVEEQGFKLDEMSRRLDQLVVDVDRRLLALESGATSSVQPQVGTSQTQPLISGASGSTASGATSSTGSLQSTQPGTLGTVSESDLAAFQSKKVELADDNAGETSSQTATRSSASETYVLQGDTPQARYQYAFSQLRQANYAEAELALRSFIKQHPDDPLAGNAQYWLGETYYVRGDYRNAAVTFAEGYKNYPDGQKASDNLLKLGLSLSSLGATDDACATFSELARRYPNAPSSITRRVSLESQKLSCP